MVINERVKFLRKDVLSLTQDDFSDKIGLGRATISKIESGDIALTDRNISAICSAFNINEKWLRTGKGDIYIEIDQDSEIMKLLGGVFAENDEFVKTLVAFMLRRSKEEWQPVKKMILDLAEIVKNEQE